jgi:mono/diheme cytochrome c family protein/glucose/arabinose dehydrogenase
MNRIDNQIKAPSTLSSFYFLLLVMLFVTTSCTEEPKIGIAVESQDRIVLVGNNLGSRMMDYGFFETEMHMRYAKDSLMIRNMCDSGDTPGFRPSANRKSQWAYEGANEFNPQYDADSRPAGHYETPDEWLTRLGADIIIGFFGYAESFDGEEGLDNFKKDLKGFIDNTKANKYNGTSAPQLVLVSPIAYEDLSDTYDLPEGKTENVNLAMYTDAMKSVADENGVPFLDVFTVSKEWYSSNSPLTIDGFQLNDKGYDLFAKYLADEIFTKKTTAKGSRYDEVLAAVKEKNYFWHHDYKVPNGVHVYGRRYDPFGPDNYPSEIEKTRQLTAIRDTVIWSSANGQNYDMASADSKTVELPEIQTNYDLSDPEKTPMYMYDEEAMEKFTVPEGYQIELFASEQEFANLANPVQMSFDNKGRLWVATMPTYPHYRPGDPRPNDKIIILEDTDNDGKADKETIFADNLHLPTGFELAPEGVYVAQGTRLQLLIDNDGDDKVDEVKTLLSGFDDHDTHHVISAFCSDPSGAIIMGEGIFLHSNVETPYGVERGEWGGFWRYTPQRKELLRISEINLPNPWGTAFDSWGQHFNLATSGPNVHWLTPSKIKTPYAVGSPGTPNILEREHMVRPTSGLEFVSSRHFPDEVQGDMLLGNTIGFLGLKQHQMMDDSSGYKTKHRQDLVLSTDPNFRPVDLEFAPDGSLYFLDWHNVLIGHMQHNARDPLRDHVHGKVYRITYPSRPLVEPAKIDGASIADLLDNLKLPEYRTRYRTKRELRGRDQAEVLAAIDTWVSSLDKSDANYEHHLVEAMWVSWGMNKLNLDIVDQLLASDDQRARAAAAKTLRYMGHQFPDKMDKLREVAADKSGRVRMEALVTASWLPTSDALEIVNIVAEQEVDKFLTRPLKFMQDQLEGVKEKEFANEMVTNLKGDELAMFKKGKLIYEKDGYCETCHQENGMGLPASGFPPLAGTDWVLGSDERLIKITLNGLHGPIEVLGRKYPGQVPMTQFRGLLNDDEVAQVLTYVRNAFGNSAPIVDAKDVKAIRADTEDMKGFYLPEDLKKQYPN